MQENEFRELLKRHQLGQCKDEEKALLESWYLSLADDGQTPSPENIQRAFDEVKSELPFTVRPKAAIFKRLASAAAIILVAASALYLFRQEPIEQENITSKISPKPITSADALPGGNRAVLTLSDGTAIDLDDAQSGKLASQGGTGINKTAPGQVVYASADKTIPAQEVLYNMISTPRGGQYHVTLPDGTKVWLNAASSLRFPTMFTGKSREVTLTGEAYFEVAENKSKPFLVSVNQSEVEVLGTHFNVMAYEDEVLTTTLLEGSVKFKHGQSEKIIVPGQAAELRGRISVSEVNTTDAIAWKNGVTAFSNADIYSIMRQISRWYDLDVEYKGRMPDRQFTGKIPRTAKLSKILKVLELSDINFKIVEKKIIVTP